MPNTGLPITALYAGLLAIVFIVLSARTILYRRAQRVEIGDGDDKELRRRMRVHANFAEYAPYTLLLIALGESLGAWPILLHVSGAALLIGRIIHAWGLSQAPHHVPTRVGGMVLTLNALGLAAAIAVAQAIPRLL